jgi:hypothetical protein
VVFIFQLIFKGTLVNVLGEARQRVVFLRHRIFALFRRLAGISSGVSSMPLPKAEFHQCKFHAATERETSGAN